MNSIKDPSKLAETLSPFFYMTTAFAVSTYALAFIGLEAYKDYKAAEGPRSMKWPVRLVMRVMRLCGKHPPPNDH